MIGLWVAVVWSTQSACAFGGVAQTMFSGASAFNQPVEAWAVGQVTSISVRRRPPREREGSRWLAGRRAFCHWSTPTLVVRVRWRRESSTARALSTSPWERGTLARPPTWWCAAHKAGVLVGSRRVWDGWLGAVLCHWSIHSAYTCGGVAQSMSHDTHALLWNCPLPPEHPLGVRVRRRR